MLTHCRKTIGTKPKRIRLEYDAPTLWTTISTMIDEFEQGLVSKVKEVLIKPERSSQP